MDAGNQPLEVEANDADSAYGEDFLEGSDTTSLRSSIYQYRLENGRRYHAYKDGSYLLPNDEEAQDNLDIANHLYTLLMKGKLFKAPLDTEKLNRVLDVGTGTGIWAIDFADKFPNAEVVGVDLSPIQPVDVPPNLKFEIDDVADPWTWRLNSFGYIHIRAMYGSIGDWAKLYRQAYDHLTPGGWIEHMEIDVEITSDDGTVTPDHAFTRWTNIFREVGKVTNKSFFIAPEIKSLIESSGFINVHEEVLKIPIRGWAKDPHLKEIGQWQQLFADTGAETHGLAILTRVLGWSYIEASLLINEVRGALKERKTHAYYKCYVVWGQKRKNAVES